MNAGVRIAGFAALLALAFGGAAVAGGAIDPSPTAKPRAHGAGMGMSPEHSDMEPAGLAVAEHGFRLALADTRFARGRTAPLRFRILGADGRAVRDFATEHEAKLHLIIVRRDLTGYRHLHPRLAPDGTWSVPARFDAPGPYRVFADFTSGGERVTLGGDVFVPGRFAPRALPAATTVARTGAYRVRLADGGSGLLRFSVSRGGREVTDLQPYLGARGHLVALREGDLAYLHVHPQEGATPGAGISFRAEYPSSGRYRLFLQFRHGGRVHTAAFTQEVER